MKRSILTARHRFGYLTCIILYNDYLTFKSSVCQLEVEAYDFVGGEYVYIGKGTAQLSFLLPTNTINIALFFHLELVAYEPRFEGPQPCEIHMRGLMSDKDPIEGTYYTVLGTPYPMW